MEMKVNCPYNQNHLVPLKNLLHHTQNTCSERFSKSIHAIYNFNLGQFYVHCPYNYLHILAKPILDDHIKIC